MVGLRGSVPNLVVAQRVIDKIAEASRQYIEDETGEALVGLVEPGTNTGGVPTIYILDTIPPDETDVVREWHTFQQGDERQYEIFTWFIENWDAQRKINRQTGAEGIAKKLDLPLIHLGDWHKQPGHMIAPSGGDLISALDQIDTSENQNDRGFLLAPIVTLDHPNTIQDGAGTNYVMVPNNDGTSLRIDFWYIHGDVRVFQPISPSVYPVEKLPELPAYPWHLQDEARASLELGQLQHDNWFVSVVLWDADGKAPLEVCLLMARQNNPQVIIIVTHSDFPKTAPKAYTAPWVRLDEDEDIYDAFEEMWEQAILVEDPRGWKWSEDMYLIDYVHAIERDLPAVAKKDDNPRKDAGSIAVDEDSNSGGES